MICHACGNEKIKKFFKNYLYYIGAALVGITLANANIYYYSRHFWFIYGAVLVMVYGAFKKAEKD